jgi:hypothetical protein
MAQREKRPFTLVYDFSSDDEGHTGNLIILLQIIHILKNFDNYLLNQQNTKLIQSWYHYLTKILKDVSNIQ